MYGKQSQNHQFLSPTDGWTDNVKTVYPHTKFVGGIMIGGTLTTVIHNVRVAVILMLELVNKRLCNYCLYKFYFRPLSVIGDAI